MFGELYIDGKDASAVYGATVTDYKGLVTFPALKSVTSVDWPEENGIDPDLSAPVLASRDISLPIAFMGRADGYETFVAALSDTAYHLFEFRVLKRSYKLRLVSTSSMAVLHGLRTAVFRFADDFPLSGYEYLAPAGTIESFDDYSFDDRKFTDYGVRVLSGSLANIETPADVKPNLLIDINTLPGSVYDDAPVVYASKDVTLNCLMRAATLDEFWRNYDALLYDLSRPGLRTLYVKKTSSTYPFFYQRGSVSSFFPDDPLWMDFTLTVKFTGADDRIGVPVLGLGTDIVTLAPGVAIHVKTHKKLLENGSNQHSRSSGIDEPFQACHTRGRQCE